MIIEVRQITSFLCVLYFLDGLKKCQCIALCEPSQNGHFWLSLHLQNDICGSLVNVLPSSSCTSKSPFITKGPCGRRVTSVCSFLSVCSSSILQIWWNYHGILIVTSPLLPSQLCREDFSSHLLLLAFIFYEKSIY